MRRVPLAAVGPAGPPATRVPPWGECCASCSAGEVCGVAECTDAVGSPYPHNMTGTVGRLSRDADDAVDGMDIFSELIDVLGVIHDGKRTGSGEKLERAPGADRGIMDDVKLIAKHWLRLNEDKENQPKPMTDADRRRRDRLRKLITQKKSEELALRVLPEVASARMRAVMVAGDANSGSFPVHLGLDHASEGSIMHRPAAPPPPLHHLSPETTT